MFFLYNHFFIYTKYLNQKNKLLKNVGVGTSKKHLMYPAEKYFTSVHMINKSF